MRTILNRVTNILIHPEAEWQVIRNEPATDRNLLLGYVAPLAAIPPFAVIAGSYLFGNLPNNTFAHLLISNLLWYCMYVLNVMVVGAVITVIVTAPDAQWTGLQGFKVAAYSFTPLFLGGFIAVIPKLGWTIYAAILYSIYLLYLGIVSIAGTVRRQAAWYAVASFLSAAVLVGVLNLSEYFLESFVF